MATETKTVFRAADITGFRIRCKNCQAAVLIPPDEGRDFPQACPMCKQAWVNQSRVTEAKVVVERLRLLRLEEADGHNPVTVEFEI